MLRIHRLRTADDPIFAPAMALYAASFPQHEQRLEPSQRRIMAHEQYHFGILRDEEGFAGLALFWDAGAYLYVEHLCISPARRGQGLGTEALDLLAGEGKPVVLEIDPPVDAISRRRQNFYERAGFAAAGEATECGIPHPHIHPPYRPENSGHALVVMSRPRPLTEDEYAAFAAYLADVVMKDCQKP